MRSVIKNTLISLLFVAILLMLLVLSSLLFRPKTNAKADGMHDPTAFGILAEPEDTIDVLVIGDSLAYSSVFPLEIWQDYGITSYVCSTPSQKLFYSAEFLRATFEKHHPKLVFLETDTVFKNFTFADMFLQDASEYLSVFRYHDRWKNLQMKDFSFTVQYTSIENNKGYRYSRQIKGTDPGGYMDATDQKAEISATNRQYIKEMAQFCEKNGARLILVSAPCVKNWNCKKHNGVEEFARDAGIEYIDMNLLPEEVPMDWSKDTRDKGEHLNHYGAVKVSSYLGKYCAEQNLFSDKRGLEKYEPWDEAVQYFKTHYKP